MPRRNRGPLGEAGFVEELEAKLPPLLLPQPVSR